MKNDTSELLTYTTVKLCCYNNKTTSTGTGFIIELCREGNKYIPALITNRHVVEGFDRYSFEMCIADSNGNPQDTQTKQHMGNVSEWILHPDKTIDLACLPIGTFISNLTSNGIVPYYRMFDTSLIPKEETLEQLFAIEDVYVIGYPIGLEDSVNHKPMIRKGITATHPRNNYQGKPEFVIDCSIFPGSSGSPVVIYNRGTIPTVNGIQLGERLILLGIVSYTFLSNLIPVEIPVSTKNENKIPNDLGGAIKAEKILDFEKILKQEKNRTK